MAELKDILKDEHIPRQASIHDIQSSAGTATITVANGFVEYVNNGLAYEDYNIKKHWNVTTNTAKDSILYNKIDLAFKTTLNASTNASYVTVKLVIPDTAGDIEVEEITIPMMKKNIDVKSQIVFGVYNGAKALEFGFKLYTKVEGGDITFSNRKLLIRA